MSSGNINIDKLKEYINIIQSKIIEINKISNKLGREKCIQPISQLNQALLKINQTIELYEEERRVWGR